MIARAGIAFSNKTTTCGQRGFENGELYTECLLDILPALHCSLYYGLRCFASSPGHVEDPHDAYLICSNDMHEIFEDEFDKNRDILRCVDQFKNILESQTAYLQFPTVFPRC